MAINNKQALDLDARTLSLGDVLATQVSASDWLNAWSKKGVTITHKGNVTSATEAWSAVKYSNLLPTALLGGDIVAGDLGVSGQSATTSTVRQEIDGKEALRFSLDEPASGVTISLASFHANDDGTGYAEGARVRLFDAAGSLVGEHYVRATETDGKQLVQLAASQPFKSMEISAGALDGTGNFVYGAYAGAGGAFATAIFTDKSGTHGSDFLVHQVVFEFARPKAAADSYQAGEDGGVQAFASVLANDGDAAGLALRAELQALPQHGTLSFQADGSFTYVPDADYFGSDSFSYRAFNGKDYSNPTLVTLDVRAVNDAPIAVDDSASVLQGSSATVIDVLANDRSGPANEAGQTLRISAASALNGAVTVDAEGRLLYTPNAGFSGADTISYTISDNGQSNGVADPRSASAVVNVTVQAVNAAPQARDDAAETDEDSAISGNVLDGSKGGRDTDPDGDALSVTSVGTFTTALGGSVTLDANGNFKYNPTASAALQALAAGASAIDSFSYTISDGHGHTSSAQVSVRVNGRDEAPLPPKGVLNASFEPGTDIDYYLRYKDDKGQSKWVAVDSFDWKVTAETSFLKGSGAAVGKPDPGEFLLELGSSKATSDFLANIMKGSRINELVLEGVVRDGAGRVGVAHEFLLTDAFVASLQTGSGATSVSFVAKEISENIAPVGAKGEFLAPKGFHWDISTMQSESESAIEQGAQSDAGPYAQVIPVDAPLDYYVRIGGTEGWFKLSDFQMGFTAPTSFTKGGGASIGKATPDMVSLELGTSVVIRDMLAKMVKGTSAPVIEIEAYRPAGASGERALVGEYLFNTALVTKVDSSDDGHNELSFVYRSFTQSHIGYDAQGRVSASDSGSFGYDVTAGAVMGAPAPVANAGVNAANAILPSFEPGADIDYYLRYQDNKGQSKWVAVDSFNWEVTAQSAFLNGGVSAVGKPDPGEFLLELGSSKATSDFLSNIMKGGRINELVLEGVVRGGVAQEFLLVDAFMTSLKTGSGATSLSLVAKEISENIAPIGAKGELLKPFEFQWNISTMQSENDSKIELGAQSAAGPYAQVIPADAQLDYYVRIGGTEGWFKLSDFQMGFTAPSSYTKGGGASIGKATPDMVTLELGTSQVIRDMLAKIVKGTHTEVIEIEAYRPAGASGERALVGEYLFNTAFMTGVDSGDDGYNELSFVYKSFTQSLIGYDAQGNVSASDSGSFGYDVATGAVIIAPVPVADLY